LDGPPHAPLHPPNIIITTAWTFFPDFGRQIPFGTGTSISYNYLDYRFKNCTSDTFQLKVWVDGEYLRGELRATDPQAFSYHIHAENEYFSRENGVVYRNGQVFRDVVDVATGNCVESTLSARITQR
jgi:VanW like protein.